MKVKGLFLSMCAIAALASCSQNEDAVPLSGNDAPKAQVTLKLEGDGVNSRAAGDPEGPAREDGAKIKNVTVFFFNQTDFIVGTPQYVSDPSTLASTPLTTTTDATQIVVIANLGSDLSGTTFKSVSSLSQLKKVDFSAITDVAGTKSVNQSANNLYSSGMGAIEMGTGEQATIGNATVKLHFISARIDKVKIAWKAGQNYAANKNDFENTTTNWFYIKQVYMMKAQTNSPLLPADAAANGTWTGGFTPQAYAFAGGVAWGTTPWEWPQGAGTAPVQTDDYLVATMPAAANNSIDNVFGTDQNHKAWYLFENTPTSDHPTGLIVEIVWRSKENSTEQDELLSKYFTVYFGEKTASGTQPLLEAGKTYNMSIALNGDFKPGGNAGGGGDDPDKPSVDSQITVTVEAAQWITTDEIVKEFQ